MDKVADILAWKNFDEPREMSIIKRYVAEHFGVHVAVRLQPNAIIIYADNASLVASLRMHTAHLVRACQTNKKLMFRIGVVPAGK